MNAIGALGEGKVHHENDKQLIGDQKCNKQVVILIDISIGKPKVHGGINWAHEEQTAQKKWTVRVVDCKEVRQCAVKMAPMCPISRRCQLCSQQVIEQIIVLFDSHEKDVNK